MALKQIKVRNITQSDVHRGNRTFPALATTTIVIDTDNNKYKEINACVSLKVVAVSDYPVVKKVTEDSKTEETKTATKDVETPTTDEVDDLTEDNEEEVVEEETEDDEVADDSEEETVDSEEDAPTEPDKDGNVYCPYCDFVGTKMGMFHHVRAKHPDKYDEFKERVKNS